MNRYLIFLVLFSLLLITFLLKNIEKKKEFIIRVDVEALFCLNKTCYWPEESKNYPYNIMEKCLINKENPDWSCENNFYSELGFIDGLIRILEISKEENVKISLALMGDVIKWMEDNQNYIISENPPDFSIKKTGVYKINDLIEDLKYYQNMGLIEIGLHATRSEDLGYEISKKCGQNYTCAEEYFDWLIKTGIKDFEDTFGKKPEFWQKHLGVNPIENVGENYSCIYLDIFEKNGIGIFSAHFQFVDENNFLDSQVVEFPNFSVKEIPIGNIKEPIQGLFPHFTTTWDDDVYIVTTHSWNFIEFPSELKVCSDCKYAGKEIFDDYSQELRGFIHEVKKNDKFISYKELSEQKTVLSELVC